MSERDRLAELITKQQVTWDEACRIADDLLDAGWGSPEEIRSATSYGFDKGVEHTVSVITAYRKDAMKLRGNAPSQKTMRRAQTNIDATKNITYGQYDAEVQGKLLTELQQNLKKDNYNPFDA